MAFNGTGVFVRLYNWVNDAAANIKIRADRMDNEMNGFATGLSSCLTKDGQTTVTANLPMAGFRHTGVGDAAALTDYATFSQLRKTAVYCATVGGTADVITLTNSPTFAAYVTGMVISWIASGANTTNVTVNVDGLGAKALTKGGSNALVANDIPGSAFLAFAQYDGSRFQLLNPYVVATAAVTDATITTTDVTTNNSSTTKHGWLKKLSNVATQYMDGTGAWSVPAVTTDATLTTTDITTNDVSTSKHGFAPKAPNDATKFLDGTGAYSVPTSANAGLTVIASGSFGAVTLLDITSIPATYRALVLYVNGASNTVATRALRIQVDTGVTFPLTPNGQCINSTTVTAVSSSNLWTDVTQTAAQVSSCIVHFPAYQSGPAKTYNGNAYLAQISGTWDSNAALSFWGTLLDGATHQPGTGAITRIRITWDNVGTGVFDAGTYALYGVN